MSANKTRRILVAGGGIGGLTAAIALRRLGFDVTAFERRNDLGRISAGSAFTLWHNAMRAYQQLGLAEQVIAHGGLIERAQIRTRHGDRLLAQWSVREHQERFGAPSIGIPRTALHSLLMQELGTDTVRLGAECTGFEQDATGVTARFADGQEERGDVLIGADGINSAIRAQILGPSKPLYAGYTTWQGIADFDHADLRDLFRVMWGGGSGFTSYPVGPRQLYWLAAKNAPQGVQDPEGGPKPGLLRHFGDWPTPIREIIAATDESRILRVDISDRQPIKAWGQGRVTLLGDAAHPMTFNLGQGACQAVEDAVMIAKHLGQVSDPVAALSAYAASRVVRTSEMILTSRRLGMLGRVKNPLLCRLRDRMIAFTYTGVGLKKHEANMAYEF